MKWRPLTYARSIVDEDGYFFPTVAPRPGFPPNRSIKEAAWKLDEIERELRAQLDAAKRHLPQATYTWYHMGFTSLDPTVAATCREADEGIRPGAADGHGHQVRSAASTRARTAAP